MLQSQSNFKENKPKTVFKDNDRISSKNCLKVTKFKETNCL